VSVVETDWLALPPFSEPQARARAVLVDPSCSGSGMSGREDEARDAVGLPARLRRLAGFQLR
jgi:16S rRNA C967 or C1407 C5-methylase (RsmB/RsmF family)